MNNKLQFINDKKSLRARIIIDTHEGTYYENINNNVEDLYNFAINNSKNRYIKLYNNTYNKVEVVTFIDANEVLREYYHKTNRNKVIYKLKKVAMKGFIYSKIVTLSIGAFASTLYLSKEAKKDLSDRNTIETNNVRSYDVLSGINKVLSENANIDNAQVIIDDNNVSEVGNSELEVTNNNIHEEIVDEVFEYLYEDRSNNDKLNKANQYESIFEKYSNMYGIDKQLLIALCAQESGGNANANSGFAKGLMQIADSLHGHNLHAYNFETGEYETENINGSMITDPDYNIKLGTMLLQYFLQEFDYNIPRAVTAYNMGDGNLLKLSKDNWMNERDHIMNADPEFFEHVFSFIEDGTTLSITRIDNNEEYTFKLDNTTVDTYVKVK